MATAPQLRPKSFTELIDSSIRLYRSHFLTFVGVVALVQVPITIAQVLIQLTLGDDYLRTIQDLSRAAAVGSGAELLSSLPLQTLLLYFGLLIVIALIQTFLVQTLCTGALAVAIARSYLGEPISITAAFQGVLRGMGSLTAVVLLLTLGSLLGMLVVAGLPVGLLVLTQGGPRENSGVLGAVLAVLLLLLLLLLYGVVAALVVVRLLFTTQAIVLEGHSAGAALRRSWELSRGSFWRILGTSLAMTALVYFATSLPVGLVMSALSLIFARDLDAQTWLTALNVLLAQLGVIVALPLQLTLYTLLYYDLRVRKEGYDLELRSLQQPALQQ